MHKIPVSALMVMFLGVIGGGLGAAAGLVSKQTSKEIVIYKANPVSAEKGME